MAEDNNKGGRNRIGQGFGKGTGGKQKTGEKLSQKQKEAGFGGKLTKETEQQTKSLKELVDTLKEQSGNVKSNVEASVDVEKSLKSLEGFMGYKSNEETLILREQFDKLKATMDEQVKLQEAGLPFNQNLLDSAQDQLEVLKEGIQSEEDKREAVAKQEEANNLLLKMSNSFDKGLGKVKETGGFLAGIAGLAALVLDPQAFANGLIKVIGFVQDMVDTVEKVFAGDFEGAATLIKDNGGIIAAILGGVLLWNMGKILKGISLFIKGFKIFRMFMMATFIPAIGAALTGIMSAMAPIIAAMLPILLPVLAIAALFGIIGFALVKIRDALGFTSVLDVIMLGVAYLQDAFAFVGNLVIDIVNFIMGIVNKVAGWIPGLDDFEVPKIERMKTDNAERKKAELEEKAAQAELQAALDAEDPPKTGMEGIGDMVAPPDISLDMAQTKADADMNFIDTEKLVPDIDMKEFGLQDLVYGEPQTEQDRVMSNFELNEPTTGTEITEMSAQNALEQAKAKVSENNIVAQNSVSNQLNNSNNTSNTYISQKLNAMSQAMFENVSSGIPLNAR